MIIELSPESAEEAEKQSKEQNRTPEELIRDLLRNRFRGGDVSVVSTSKKISIVEATKTEEEGIRKGREEIKRGRYKNLNDLVDELDRSHRKKSRKTTKKAS